DKPEVLAQVATLCRQHKVPLVLDLDDDLLNVPTDKDPTLGFMLYRPAMVELLKATSMLTVSTEPLAKAYAGLTRSVRIVPNRLDPRVWLEPLERDPNPPKGFDEDAAIRVLYMGSPTHHEDLQLILPAFARLRSKHRVQLHTIGVTGAKTPEGFRPIVPPHPRYDHFIAWFRSIVGHFDLAVAPLLDTPFNRCKSDLKFLEYAACGLPVVASRVVPYSLTVRDGEDGLLADNDEDSWFNAIESLVLQPELRARLGAAARLRAETEFMVKSCVFDEFPWTDWGAETGAQPAAAASVAQPPRRAVEVATEAWGA
ncbi:MAG TPA: glycosyltransferase, partial [Polyangiaceae bacterium]|nr:glycosyltransferase [Polyangiaceae bacterium]